MSNTVQKTGAWEFSDAELGTPWKGRTLQENLNWRVKQDLEKQWSVRTRIDWLIESQHFYIKGMEFEHF